MIRRQVGADNAPGRLRHLQKTNSVIFRFRSKDGRSMVLLGAGRRGPEPNFSQIRVAKTCGLHAIWERQTAMNASNSSMFQNSVCTRVLKLTTSGSNPWVVCTLDSVPVILARFESREAAEAWHNQLSSKSKAA
ncbi:MAG: hypothetical protein CMJ29_09495 [Phycisphaerae bacterium]|nr:hypothetical protein [Phycisphaerae bacterium]